jgi:hypothetical protein
MTPVFDKKIIMEGSWFNLPRIIGSGVAYMWPDFAKDSLRKKVYFEKNDRIETDVKVGGFQFFYWVKLIKLLHYWIFFLETACMYKINFKTAYKK